MGFLRQYRGTRDVPTAMPDVAGRGDSLDPEVAGVSLEMYVTISRAIADVGYDASKGPELAAVEGIGPLEWDAAVAGWNARMQDDPTVARRFNMLYVQR